jgi:hypothetical protein
MKRRLVLATLFVLAVAVAVTGAFAQAVRGQRPLLLAGA